MDVGFLACSLACSAVLVASFALPHILIGYPTTRTYFQMMVVLSPSFVVGGAVVAGFLRMKRGYVVVLMALIPWFMCNSGTMYQIFDVPRAITLNSEGGSYDSMFIHDQEVSATDWLENHAGENTRTYTDYSGHIRSLGLELAMGGGMGWLFEGHEPPEDAYVYLRYCAVVDGRLMGSADTYYRTVQYEEELDRLGLIYTNGGS